MSVEDNLYLVPYKKSREEEENYRENLLKKYDLDIVRHNKCKNLSGGELHKLEFCLCLATYPSIILLDEPFAGMDPKTTKMVIEQIRDLNSQGIGFFIIDHRISELKEVCEEYLLLDEGKIVFHGKSDVFFRDEVVKDVFLG